MKAMKMIALSAYTLQSNSVTSVEAIIISTIITTKIMKGISDQPSVIIVVIGWRSNPVVIWRIWPVTIGVNHYTTTEKQGRKNNESDTHGESPGGCAILLAHPVMVVK
jgi:hypothetical protein